MEKDDIKNRIDSIRDNAENDRKQNGYKPKECPSQKPSETGKVCPFSLSSGKARICGNWCQLHRQGKSAFACPLQELSTISWNSRK